MVNLQIQQAVYDAAGERWLAESPEFADDWRAEAERLAADFGDRPAGVDCPGCVFAQPFGPKHVAVVQAADWPTGSQRLRFRFLVLGHDLYRALGDPFAIADRFLPPWGATGELPALEWPPEPLPPRRVEQVQHALQTGDSQFLLGAAQALLDGGKILLVRPAPDETRLRDLWLLLPDSTRRELWPASFAFRPERFDAVVLPQIEAVPEHYLTEQQAGDYPEGRYELALQVAAEAGDQRGLDRLFARRSSREALRFAMFLLLAAVVLAIVVRLLPLAG